MVIIQIHYHHIRYSEITDTAVIPFVLSTHMVILNRLLQFIRIRHYVLLWIAAVLGIPDTRGRKNR